MIESRPWLLLALSLICWTTVVGGNECSNSYYDCMPDHDVWANLTHYECGLRGCCWRESDNKCLYPSTWGYRLLPYPEDGWNWTLNPTGGGKDRYSDNIVVAFKAIPEGPSRLQLKFTDEENSRYEIPPEIATLNPPSVRSNELLYDVERVDMINDPFLFRILRRSTGKAIFEIQGIGFTFEDQFIEVNLKLMNDAVYGFGEHEHPTFQHSFDGRHLPMFSRGHPVSGAGEDNIYPNLYGTHPFFMGLDDDGLAYGVLYWNSNAQEVVLQKDPHGFNVVTYRTIGGMLDLRVIVGSTPTDVIQQYHEMIGKPYFPPYWALGFQLAKASYGNLDAIKSLHKRMKYAEIPWDVQHFDTDHMDRQRAFTTDLTDYSGISDFVQQIRQDDIRSVVTLTPAITGNDTTWEEDRDDPDKFYLPWLKGIEGDIWIKFPADQYRNASISYSKAWPEYPNATQTICHSDLFDSDAELEGCRASSAFPDWFKPQTKRWWAEQLQRFHGGLLSSSGETVAFDGVTIDMNEPETLSHGSINFKDYFGGCPESKYNNPPYLPHVANRTSGLSFNTLCLSTEVSVGESGKKMPFYNVHNLYGHRMTVVTSDALNKVTRKRSMVFSRSTFPGSGAFGGHWLGDNKSTWHHLHQSVIGVLEMNIFGIPYTGANICGFLPSSPGSTELVDPELCYRWMQLGAFYPFSRSNAAKDKPHQDPASFGTPLANASKRALETRYTLLPYLYTLMYDAHQSGGTVVRSLMEEFPRDKETWNISSQFMWGSGLLITPVMTKGAATVKGYLPVGRWFNYYDGAEFDADGSGSGRRVNFTSPLENYEGDIPLHVRGGQIVPFQKSALTTAASRLNPIGLLVALNSENIAKGKLYWDDGESDTTSSLNGSLISMLGVQKNKLVVSTTFHNFLPDTNWDIIKVYGLDINVESVMLALLKGPIQSVLDLESSENLLRDPIQHLNSFEYDEENRVLTISLINSGIAVNIMESFVLSWSAEPHSIAPRYLRH